VGGHAGRTDREPRPGRPAAELHLRPRDGHDNPALLKANPEYLARLQGLTLVERERLLRGNWNIRFSAGNYFKRHWFGR